MKKAIITMLACIMCFGMLITRTDTVQANTTEKAGYKDIFFSLSFPDPTAEQKFLIIGNNIMVKGFIAEGISTWVDLDTDELEPGTYEITIQMDGYESDEYFYEMGGNIYDKQNDISLPTTWKIKDRTYIAEFTITQKTNQLALGERGTYIVINEPSYTHRNVMSISLRKEVAILPFQLSFYDDSNHSGNLFFMDHKLMVTAFNVDAHSYTIDLKTPEPLHPGNYIITFSMNGLPSDEFLYENGGNLYDRQNGISLHTEWSKEGHIITAEFTIATPTNRISLGEGGTYISVNEASPITREVMSVSLDRKEDRIPLALAYPYDESHSSAVYTNGNRLMVMADQVISTSSLIQLEVDTLEPGTYIVVIDMIGAKDDQFYHGMAGNMYDKQNGISLPTTWSVHDQTITAQFTVTSPTNRLLLGESGTYITTATPCDTDRPIMSVSLIKTI